MANIALDVWQSIDNMITGDFKKENIVNMFGKYFKVVTPYRLWFHLTLIWKLRPKFTHILIKHRPQFCNVFKDSFLAMLVSFKPMLAQVSARRVFAQLITWLGLLAHCTSLTRLIKQIKHTFFALGRYIIVSQESL